MMICISPKIAEVVEATVADNVGVGAAVDDNFAISV
jgi:hypothetical protein